MRMRNIFSYLVLVSVIGLVCSAINCSSSESDKESVNDWAIYFIEKVPYDTSIFGIYDLRTVRTDPELSLELDNEDNDSIFSMYGLAFESDDLDYAVSLAFESDDLDYAFVTDYVVIFAGTIDINTNRELFNRDGSNYREISDIEVWNWEVKQETYTAFNGCVAIYDNLLIVSSTEDVLNRWIDFITTGSPSLYENAEFNDLFCKLPDGFSINYNNSFPIDWELEGYKASLEVTSKKDKKFWTSTGIVSFSDEANALAAYPGIMTFLDDWDTESSNLDVTVEGKYIHYIVNVPF